MPQIAHNNSERQSWSFCIEHFYNENFFGNQTSSHIMKIMCTCFHMYKLLYQIFLFIYRYSLNGGFCYSAFTLQANTIIRDRIQLSRRGTDSYVLSDKFVLIEKWIKTHRSQPSPKIIPVTKFLKSIINFQNILQT